MDLPLTRHLNNQTENFAVVPPTDRIIHMDRVQTYEGGPTSPRPRKPLANWISVSLGNQPSRPTVDEMTLGQLQWNMVNDTTGNKQGHRHDDHDNKPSEEMESINGYPIYSDDDGSTLGPGLEEVD